MKDTLIACPMRKEADALRRRLPVYPGLEVLASGIGIKRSLPVLLQRFRSAPPSLLIFTGSVSQLNPELDYRQVVLVRKWMLENSPTSFETSPPEDLDLSGEITELEFGLSITRPVMKPEERKAVFAERGAEVYDSLTAAVVRVAQTSQVPVVTPKIVANTLDSGIMAFWSRLEENIQPLVNYLNNLLVTFYE